jgi:hypothetical protein
VVFSSDGKYIASGSWDKTVKLWDVATGRELRTFSGHSAWVPSIAFSPDGKYIASCGDVDKEKYSSSCAVLLWDAVSGREIRAFTSGSIIFRVTFSPDGKYIAASSAEFDNSNSKYYVKLWDTASGSEILTLTGHSNSVNSVSFSPDGTQIASGSRDKTIKLWDTATGKEIKTFTGQNSFVTSLLFSPDGTQILSAGDAAHLWDIASGKEIVRFISFSGSDSSLASATRGLTVETQTAAASNDGEWLSITPDGYYQAAPRGDRYINVRVGNTVSGIDSYRSVFYNPDVVQARLAGRPDPASKANVSIQQAAAFMPPTVTIQSPVSGSTTTTATANLSVAVTDHNQPIKNIRVFVNGRPAGRNELAAVKGGGLRAERTSLTVTGNQKTVSFTMPLELDPGANRIEVVAFNGYSDTRRHIDVTWNAPAGQRPALPNLWILAVGVNAYDNAGPRLGGLTSLNFCVADAKGLIDSLKAQEGKRYAKVNSLLIADGEATIPTAANIRQTLKFLDQAGERDVVLLFLAGHGISGQEGKFFFLPRDAAFSSLPTSSTPAVVDTTRALSGDEMVAVLEGPGNRLLFIDACQSGGVDNDRMVRAMMESNAFVFAASQGYELSYGDPRWGHGAFTYSILNALGGAPAALAEGNVSVRSMSGFVSIEVPKLTGNRQNPKVHSLLYCDFPMAVIK